MYQQIVVATAAALVLSGCYGKGLVRTARPQQTSVAVVTGSFEVAARGFKPFKVVVAAGAMHPQIEGTFSATGRNNDIEVLLLEESQYLNWQNRHKFTAAYDSGRVTADKFKMALPPEPATYYMIFSNRFSLISTKAVAAEVTFRSEYSKKGN
jgi:hypothetical protein